MAEATPQILKSFPWPTQADITVRKQKMKAIVARLFSAAAEKGKGDVEQLLKDDPGLKAEVLKSLTDDDQKGGELAQWSDNFTKELAKRQLDKEKEEAEAKKKEEAIQARRDQERAKREEEERRAAEDRREGRGEVRKKVKRPHEKLSRSISHKRDEKTDKKKKKKASSSEDESESNDRNAKSRKAPARQASPPPRKKSPPRKTSPP